jgi:hypothetical protein
MATHIVSWGGGEHVILPVPSSTPSIVSVDSVLSHERETYSIVQEATPTVQNDHTADDSFTRHHKYFFKDGNVTFLVREV